jgi:hypothetical protein
MSNQALREAIDHLFAEHNNKIDMANMTDINIYLVCGIFVQPV